MILGQSGSDMQLEDDVSFPPFLNKIPLASIAFVVMLLAFSVVCFASRLLNNKKICELLQYRLMRC